MAKTTNPLHSLTASGSIARRITFTNRRDSATAKNWHTPRASASLNQLTRRAIYRLSCAAWRALSPAEKTAWDVIARERAITGFNAFMSATIPTISPAGITLFDGGATMWDGGATVFFD